MAVFQNAANGGKRMKETAGNSRQSTRIVIVASNKKRSKTMDVFMVFTVNDEYPTVVVVLPISRTGLRRLICPLAY